MKNNTKIVLILMTIISIIIIIITTLLIIVINSNKSEIVLEDEDIPHIDFSEVDEVTDRNRYYMIKTILNKYYTNVNYLQADITQLGEIELQTAEEEKQIVDEYTNMAITALKNMLDAESIKYLQLNDNEDYLQVFEQYKNNSYRIEKMYYVEKTVNTNVYYINISVDNEKQVGIIIKTDSYNKTFSIYPEEYVKLNSFDETSIEDNFNIESIEYIDENEDNLYNIQDISDNTMAQYYLYDYGDLVINDISRAYQMLDEDYKQNKFPTLDSYTEYVENSDKNYNLLELKKYSIEENDDYTIFKCEDQYSNKYVFKDTNIMEYTLQLDTYTLEDEEQTTSYLSQTSKNKGILNIDKFFQMINMQDYESAYNVLDNSFKQNYFSTQAQFESYVKQNMYKYNKVTYNEYSNKITSLHTYAITLTDIEEEIEGSHDYTFNIKLSENTEFTLSFNVE